MNYLQHFGFETEPFANASRSRFFFSAPHHQGALRRLFYAASQMKGLAVLVGDVGLGKSTIARRLMEGLATDSFEAALLVIVHGELSPLWLLKRIALQLGVRAPTDDKLVILSQLYQRLVAIERAGKRAVVIIDEAQMLRTPAVMEEFRSLLNLEVKDRKLITFILCGLPDLEAQMALDPALSQRVALRIALRPFEPRETAAYVRHCLSAAGGARAELLDSDCLDEIHRSAQGAPRLVNTLCDNVLLELFFAGAHRPSVALVREVAHALGLRAADAPIPIVSPVLVSDEAMELALPVLPPMAALTQKPSAPREEPRDPLDFLQATAVESPPWVSVRDDPQPVFSDEKEEEEVHLSQHDVEMVVENGLPGDEASGPGAPMPDGEDRR